MLESMNQMLEVTQEFFKVVPRERLQKLADKVLVRPVRRAMKKLDQPDVTEDIQKAIDHFLDDFTPESMVMLVLTLLVQNNQVEVLASLLELLDSSKDDMKAEIEKFVSVIEKHALAIGRVVEMVIILSQEIKTDLLSDEE